MARLVILTLLIVSIALQNALGSISAPLPSTKDATIAKARLGGALGRQLIDAGISVWTASVDADPSLPPAAKKCVDDRVKLVQAAVDAQIVAYMDSIIQRLSAATNAEAQAVFSSIIKELFKDSGVVSTIQQDLGDQLTDAREDCEELYDNSP